MTLSTGSLAFVCLRCGEVYEPAHLPRPSPHPVHPEDGGAPPPLARPNEYRRRRDLLAGLYQRPCPVCGAGPNQWCRTVPGAESMLDMHPERRP